MSLPFLFAATTANLSALASTSQLHHPSESVMPSPTLTLFAPYTVTSRSFIGVPLARDVAQTYTHPRVSRTERPMSVRHTSR